MRGRRGSLAAVTAAAALALVAGACGGDELGGSLELADLGRCPDPLVVQTDWFPQPEHGALYHLTAGQGRVDPSTGRFRGPLAVDPTITLEIRAGGPYLETTPLRTMVVDDDVFLASVNTDDAVANHERFPTTAVVAPLDISPLIVMWDPATYEIESWSDVIDTEAVLFHADGAAFVNYLVDVGLVDDDQPDPGYDGSPNRFIRSGGQILQQGFATHEPYNYANVFVEWGLPVGSLLVHDAGYEIYHGPLAILDERLDADARACLAAFVPLVQQAIVDFQHDPTSTNALLVEVVGDLDTTWQLTDDGVANTVVQMGAQEIVGNGGNGTIGDFDLGRIEELIALLDAKVESIPTTPQLRPEDLVTNEFLDPDIGL